MERSRTNHAGAADSSQGGCNEVFSYLSRIPLRITSFEGRAQQTRGLTRAITSVLAIRRSRARSWSPMCTILRMRSAWSSSSWNS